MNKWWAYFEKHQHDIEQIIYDYASNNHIAIWRETVLLENSKDKWSTLDSIMNNAWHDAPDKRWVYSIAGFSEMCNLLDGTVPCSYVEEDA